MTWSIGFRAPAWRDLLAAWVDERYATMPGDARYGDPARIPASDPGEIPPGDLAHLVDGLRRAMSADDRELTRWLGRHLTEPKGELLDIMPLPGPMPPDATRQVLDGASRLERHGAARLAWIGGEQCVHLYVNGREHTLPQESASLVSLLCGRMDYDSQALQVAAAPVPGGTELLLELCAAGILLPVAGDADQP